MGQCYRGVTMSLREDTGQTGHRHQTETKSFRENNIRTKLKITRQILSGCGHHHRHHHSAVNTHQAPPPSSNAPWWSDSRRSCDTQLAGLSPVTADSSPLSSTHTVSVPLSVLLSGASPLGSSWTRRVGRRQQFLGRPAPLPLLRLFGSSPSS